MQIIIFKLLLALLASSLFGYQRQRAHKPVGFGTFIFVCLGSCALGVIAYALPNSLPLLGAVVTGIGFLGAGALIRGADRVFGFTTAASLWLFAILGLIIGIGEYLIGGIIYGSVWLVIVSDYFLEKKGLGSYQTRLTITTKKIIGENEIRSKIFSYTKRHKLLVAEINKETNELQVTYLIEGGKDNLNKMIRSLYSEEWFKSAKIE
ncbi:MAG: MgtC/SapB family protein [Candidatus Woesearchaeota archaeon]